eukprot:443034-Hanusia_phi.AAC.2
MQDVSDCKMRTKCEVCKRLDKKDPDVSEHFAALVVCCSLLRKISTRMPLIPGLYLVLVHAAETPGASSASIAQIAE